MASGEKYRRYAEVSFPLLQKYAQKCGADFYTKYQENPKHDYIGYQKWDYVNFLNYYDRILHIDTDMIVRENTPNLFDIVAPNEFGAVDEHQFASPSIEQPYVDRYQDLINYAGPDFSPKFYINVGMFLFSAEHYHLFDTVDKAPFYKEQTVLNYLLHYHRVKMKLLDPKFNFMSIMENHGLDKKDAHIVHYAGGWRGYSTDEVIRLMKEDMNVS